MSRKCLNRNVKEYSKLECKGYLEIEIQMANKIKIEGHRGIGNGRIF